jgi:myo-inositol 2-dehydrogenase/D-chiro-inositol 1-dehydrogenase
MPEPLKVAIAGVGRMGFVHALHLKELATDGGSCTLAAIADASIERAGNVARELGCEVPVFDSVDALTPEICDAVVVVTPTDSHRDHASSLISRGLRVLVEKPLTGTLEGDREFAAALDRDHPEALMLAFQRRFDEPLQYAKQLMGSGAVGRVFKIYSSLEDSNPAPDGYNSSGILPDMSVHNVDEILWLTGAMPRSALAVGSRLHSHRLTTCQEDFDDAVLLLWFEGEMMAQVQVSRNHVSGYRVETIIFGETGQIHIGRFEQKPLEVLVEAYGKRGRAEPIVHRTFTMRDYGRPLPEFVDRFGPAYKAELAQFIDCCRANQPFPTSHRDGLRAQEVISAGMQAVLTEAQAAAVGGIPDQKRIFSAS